MTKANLLKILKFLRKKQQLSRIELLKYISQQDIDTLLRNKYVYQPLSVRTQDGMGGFVNTDDDVFKLNDAGVDYLDDNATDLRRTWWPHIVNALLAIIAIIISLIALNKA